MLNNDSYDNIDNNNKIKELPKDVKSHNKFENHNNANFNKPISTQQLPLSSSSKNLERTPVSKKDKNRPQNNIMTQSHYEKTTPIRPLAEIKTQKTQFTPYRTEMLQSRIRTDTQEGRRRRTTTDRISVEKFGLGLDTRRSIYKSNMYHSRALDEYNDDRTSRYRTNAIDFVNDMYSNIDRVLGHHSSVRI